MPDNARLIIRMKNAENQRLREIPTQITFHRDDRKIGQTLTRDFANVSEAFDLPAFPLGTWRCTVAPDRYEARTFIFPVVANKPPVEKDLWAPRNPGGGWNVQFHRWSKLGRRHESLKSLLERSPRLVLKVKSTGDRRALNKFAGAAYDNVDDTDLVEGKTGMLNTFAKMLAERAPGSRLRWSAGIQELLAIQRDRIIGVANPWMAQLVREIIDQPDFYPTYGEADSSLHGKNIQAGIDTLNLPAPVKRTAMYSIKSKDPIGVLQLTIAEVTDGAGDSLFLVDADIDENGNLLKHMGDAISHRFNGGTHPFHVHDILHRTLGRASLGYHLV